MIRVQIAYESAARVPAVHALLERVVSTDPDWSGAEFKIEIGDFTDIDCDDEIAGTSLLRKIFRRIEGGE